MEGSLDMIKGAWGKEEDDLLRAGIHRYGEGKWHLVPATSGLRRYRKSCRLRWLNYLNPSIKRGDFSEDEIDVMIRMHKLLGNRWSLIAGRLPGRTSNDVKIFWNTFMSKKKASTQMDENDEKLKETTKTHVIIKPQARCFSKNSPWLRGKLLTATSNEAESAKTSSSSSVASAASASPESPENWWETLLEDPGRKEGDITYSLNGLDSYFINDLWDNGKFAGMTTKDNEILMKGPIDWSDFSLSKPISCELLSPE